MKDCPITFTMKIIGGKWKPIIISRISDGINRFGKLMKSIDGINKQMLTNQLKELEADGIIDRIVYAEIPPRVEYKMTEKGKSLFWIIEAMKVWGEENMPEE